MTKLVVLRLQGDLSQGVEVTLEIGEENSGPSINIKGSLPPAPNMIQMYDQWQYGYRSLGKKNRITPIREIDHNITPEKCCKDADLVCECLNEWLDSQTFARIKKKCDQHLNINDEVLVLICTDSDPLRRLPWQQWNLLEDYPSAEVALSATEYEHPTADNKPRERKQVKILVILGDSTGINVDEDKQSFKKIPNADTEFLVEPQLEDISDQLWNQDWDIIYFAGHSRSEGETGRIYINKTESLTIEELKRGLEKAVQNGLQLAIFNSCDGVGLARPLQDLRIPRLIVMREPVDDQAAQRFLKYFLKAFAEDGKKFYLAVRDARQRLEDLQHKLPCANLMPVIFMLPAVGSLTWNQLRGLSSESSSTALDQGTQPSKQEFCDRQRLLTKVKSNVDEQLEQSLHKNVVQIIHLHKKSQRQQVEQRPLPLNVVLKISGQQTEPPQPTNKEIIEVFDQKEIAGKLLILGDPGSGKTTTLLELARDLINRAESNHDEPMPVLFNLPSWKDDNQTIAQWLVAELKYYYGVPKDIGNRWLDNQQLLPLLDGLDELKSERQARCIKAINRFEQNYRFTPMVVCTRLEEYEFCRTKLQLNGAICLQPLSSDQIQQYLEQAKQPQLWQSIKDNSDLSELAKTPLLLGIMTLAFQEISLQEWQSLNSSEERRRYLFDTYISCMLKRDISQRWYASGKEPTPEQTKRWLGYLAKMLLKQEAQTEFLIEKMQPHWLPFRDQRLYRIGVGLITGLIVGLSTMFGYRLIMALLVGLNERLILEPLRGLLGGLIAVKFWKSFVDLGLAYGLLWAIIGGLWQRRIYSIIGSLILGEIYNFIITGHNLGEIYNFIINKYNLENSELYWGLIYGLIGVIIVEFGKKVRPVETLGFSWKKARFFGLRSGVFFGIIFALLAFFTQQEVMLIIAYFLFFGLIFGLCGALICSIIGSGIDINKRTIPNQAIWQSAVNAGIFALIGGLMCMPLLYLIMSSHPNDSNIGDNAETLNISWIITIFVSIPALIPGFAWIQHFSLRAVLCWRGLIPWDYARFLNYAREKMLLQQIGGRYRFIHDLLRERFAQM